MSTTPRPIADPELDRVLSELDPVRTEYAADSPTARALLARIVASPMDMADPVVPHARPPRSARRRFAWAGVTAVGLVAAVILIPSPLGLQSASAQWVAQPTGVSAADVAAEARECTAYLANAMAPIKPGQNETEPSAEAISALPGVLAESRGRWLLVIAGDEQWSAFCLHQRPGVAEVVLPWTQGPGGGGVSRVSAQGRAPAADEVTTVDIAGVATGRDPNNVGDAAIAVTGFVGADVRAVVVTPSSPAGHEPVHATVTAGRWAAWWPSNSAIIDDGFGVFTITATLADGSTRTFAPGSRQTAPMPDSSPKG